MKLRLTAIFLLLFAISGMFVPGPALAMDGHDCSHDHVATVESLINHVTHAAAHGHIDNVGIATALLATLDAVQTAVELGQSKAATGSLLAFIAQVEAQSGRHIDADHAPHLVMHAEMVLEKL